MQFVLNAINNNIEYFAVQESNTRNKLVDFIADMFGYADHFCKTERYAVGNVKWIDSHHSTLAQKVDLTENYRRQQDQYFMSVEQKKKVIICILSASLLAHQA